MASNEVKVPDIGDFKNVEVIEVLVKPGERIAKEQSLITLESDKATMEIPSPGAGVVKELRVKVGDKVSQGSAILVLEGAAAGEPPAKEAPAPNVPMLVFLVFLQVIYVCMIYGPIAAYLVEAFPARIRYTSLSLPYHIGNGVFGGLLPLIGLWTCAATGNIYAGLYYPIIVASLTFVVGSLLLKETHGTKIWDEVKA